MRPLAAIRLLALTFSLAIAPADPVIGQQPTIDAQREARAFIQTFEEASSRKDRAQLERLIAPEFTAIDRAGTARDRATWIELVVSGAMLAQKTESEQLSDDLTIFGTSAAIRTTLSRFQDLARARDISTKTRTVYARLDRGWQVLSMQQTQLHDGPIVTTSFDGVIGTYVLEAGRPFTIARTGRTLFATLPTGVANVPLFETEDGRLVGPGGEFIYIFDRDANGRATTVTMTRYGKPVWRAKRAE